MGSSGYYVFDDGKIAVTHLGNRNPNGTLVVAKSIVRPIVILKSTLKMIGRWNKGFTLYLRYIKVIFKQGKVI